MSEKQQPTMFKKLAVNALKLGLTVLAIYLILQKVDIQLVSKYLGSLKLGYFVLAIISFFISKFISSIRLNEYYNTQNIFLGWVTNAKLYFNAMFYNIFIPLVGGEAYKVLWIKKELNTETKPLIWSALLDRGNGLLALIILAVLFFNLYPNDYAWAKYTFAIIPLSLFVSWGVHKWIFPSFLKAFTNTTGLSLIVQALQVLTIYFVIISLGVDQYINAYILVFLISSFAYVLPFLGARELAFVYGAEYLGLNNELSLVISILFYICLAINSIAGGVFFFIPIKSST